ncbi:MAG: transglutaminaseTgpA domain-containing protein [Actinobacteria bacterium]|nr:transglutaminaseTgpA domain-containing protein [Actinomycetota bacterium]
MRPARHGFEVAALAAVSAVAAAGCCRLFDGSGWVVPVFAAVAGAFLAGVLTARRSGTVALAAHSAGLLVLLVESVGGQTAYGIPTPATLAALGRAAGRAPDAFRAAIVPAPATPELILMVVAGVWIATAAAHWLAERQRAGLVAVLPLTAFPLIVAALGTGRLRATFTFAFAAAISLFAIVERNAGLPTVAATLLRATPRPPGRAVLRPRGGFAWPALAVGLAAVVLGPVVPGVGRAVVDVHAFGVALDVSRVEMNPLVDIKPQLLTPRRTELFTVRATAPAYWRLTALDRFDGRRWSPSRPSLSRHRSPEADTGVTGDRALHQDFSVTALDSPWLPAADRAIRIKAAGARLDPETDSLVTKKGSRSVRAYRVESRLPRDPLAPRVAGETDPGDRRPGPARYLALPSGFPRAVRELAERFTAGAQTPYDRAVALEDSLRGGFIYDENAPPGASVDALHDFLFGSHRGYCEQFAGAYAAMARSLGLPTRVAVGFTPGTYDTAEGLWRVTTREAHAWPEVYLSGLGWTAFEPTPGRVLPDPKAWVRPATSLEQLAASRPSGRSQESALARVDAGGEGGLDAGPANRPGGLGGVAHQRTLWWIAAISFGLVLVPPAAKSRRRATRRRARAHDAVLAAWSEALDRLSEAGLTRRGEETPLEFARRAGTARPGVAPAMRRLAVLVNGAAYGLGGEDRAVEAWTASDKVVQAIDDHDPGWVRWRRRVDPRTLFAR